MLILNESIVDGILVFQLYFILIALQSQPQIVVDIYEVIEKPLCETIFLLVVVEGEGAPVALVATRGGFLGEDPDG